MHVVIELPGLPVGRIVAVVTLIAEATAMRILVAVACHASAVCIVKRCGRMATLTRDIRVGTDEWKTCDVMIEPNRSRPTGRNVASFALVTELPLVHIVVDMAAAAGLRQFIVEIAGVTAAASEASVAGRQRKARTRVVVEKAGIPVEGVVASATIPTEAAFVDVVLAMTGAAAGVAEVGKVVSAMTALAAHVFVTSEQGKSRQSMVIEGGILPARGTVTIGTLGAVLTFVNVIGLMAGNTGSPDIGEIVALVTRGTGRGHVAARQYKVRGAVIEFRFGPGV